MNETISDSPRPLSAAIYWILILTSVGVVTGRICAVKSKKGDTPFLSANDRSRWCAIRALGDYGEFSIDRVVLRRPQAKSCKQRFDSRWDSIDKVRHLGRDGKQHYYSSKPPLLPTLLAGEYWLLKHIIGADFDQQLFYTARAILITTNVLPWIAYLFLVSRLVERFGVSQWGRLFVMATAAWGTFLSTFTVTLNNHLPAAISAMAALAAALPIWRGKESRWRYFAAAGFFAAFAAANELPALSFTVLLGAMLLWKAPRKTLAAYFPICALVATCFFGVNYIAHGSFRPPYAHRSDGPVVAVIELPPRFTPQDLVEQEEQFLRFLQSLTKPDSTKPDASGFGSRNDFPWSAQAVIEPTQLKHRWSIYDPPSKRRFVAIDEGDVCRVREWDNWYDYECSYWIINKRGVDKGEPSRLVYAFHLVAGHHGLLSLTPVWLLSLLGAGLLILRPADRYAPLRGFAALAVALTVICLSFYILRPQADRNYGGLTCGLRWMFWLTPFWLLCLIPAADRIAQRKWMVILAGGLLLVSVFSAHYASLNPWSHPWLYDYWQYLGWLEVK